MCKLKQFLSRLKTCWPVAVLALTAPVVFYAQEWLTHNPWTTMFPEVQLFDILLYELIYFFLFFLTGQVRWAIWIGTVFLGLVGFANYFVMAFRSTPIVPWDLYSISTAASVADNFEYELTVTAWIVLLVLILVMILGFFCRFRLKGLGLPIRLAAILITATAFGGCTHLLHQDSFLRTMSLDNTLFTPHVMARKNGFLCTFLMDLRYLSVETPEGYSREQAEQWLNEKELSTDSVAKEELPNIIVIMDEAFSDPAVLGDFGTNMDYMPYVHKLQQGADNTITGTLNVSVKGGNTANTEFEFLTGHTMRFLTAGSIPYQQYIFDETESMASWLGELGYDTCAIHPYFASGWNRNKVYPYFGFDRMLFNTDFTGAQRIRKYTSDEACFDKILSLLDSQPEDDPLFVFAVTMQNHSSYSEDFDNFTPDITLDHEEYPMLEKYLSLMKITDEALEDFIYEISQSSEDTMVVFFGDHQPNDIVIEPVWRANGTASSKLTDEESDRRYQVPYVIWANFDIESRTEYDTSANYLGAIALKAAGVPLSPYQQCIMEVRKEVPIVTTQTMKSFSKNEVLEESDCRLLLQYQTLQYYQLFDQ